MKVCVLDPSFFTLPYDQHLCEGLSREGVDVTLCGRPMRPTEVLYPHAYRIAHRCYRFTEGPGRRLRNPGLAAAMKSMEHAWSMWRLGGWLRREAFDVIHVQWSPVPLFDRWAWRAWSRTSRLVYTVHDTEPFLGQATHAAQHLGWCGLLDVPHRLFVHTAGSRTALMGMGVTAERIARVAHGPLFPVHPVKTGPTPGSCGAGRQTILVFGEIKRYKGIDVLLRAAARLPRALAATWRILIAGRPRMDLGELRELAQHSVVPVEWRLGFVPDEEMGAMFNQASVAAFPYRNIDASGALMMALPFRVPVIASDVGVFSEVLGAENAALLVPPGDVAALAGALARLLSDPELRAALRRGIDRCLDDRLSWQKIARDHVRVYEQTPPGTGRRGRHHRRWRVPSGLAARPR